MINMKLALRELEARYRKRLVNATAALFIVHLLALVSSLWNNIDRSYFLTAFQYIDFEALVQ